MSVHNTRGARLVWAARNMKHELRNHTCPKDLVSYRNISNILEEAPICSTNRIYRAVGERKRAAFKARETGDIPIARRWSRAAAASEGVASERSETRRPEPLVGIKKVIGTRETGDSLSRRRA